MHKNIGNHVHLLNREHVVDRDALQVTHWIGEYFVALVVKSMNYLS
jgi:hypothetical protein